MTCPGSVVMVSEGLTMAMAAGRYFRRRKRRQRRQHQRWLVTLMSYLGTRRNP